MLLYTFTKGYDFIVHFFTRILVQLAIDFPKFPISIFKIISIERPKVSNKTFLSLRHSTMSGQLFVKLMFEIRLPDTIQQHTRFSG